MSETATDANIGSQYATLMKQQARVLDLTKVEVHAEIIDKFSKNPYNMDITPSGVNGALKEITWHNLREYSDMFTEFQRLQRVEIELNKNYVLTIRRTETNALNAYVSAIGTTPNTRRITVLSFEFM